MTVLVLGASGQLASHLRGCLTEAVYWGRDQFDLRRPDGLCAAIEGFEPTCIVNAAAYTAVDKAETEREAAWALNAEAPAVAARAAARLNVPLLHVSTDYVFDGAKRGEYDVRDGCRPINAYGASKLGGELAVRLLAPKSWVLRTSWVFSEFGANFVKTILRLAGTQKELRVVSDQLGRPTYAEDLACLIAQVVHEEAAGVGLPHGIYHAVGGEAVSWHEFAAAIVATASARGRLIGAPQITAIATSEYPTPARRPHNSVLAPSPELKALTAGGFDWRRGLERVIERLPPGGSESCSGS